MEMNAANVAQHEIFIISFWRPEVTSLSEPKVENLIKQLFHSRSLDMRLVIANSYPTRAHGIIVNYTVFRTSCNSVYALLRYFVSLLAVSIAFYKCCTSVCLLCYCCLVLVIMLLFMSCVIVSCC